MKPPILFALALILSIGVLCQDRPREQNPPETPRAETTLNVPTRVDFQGRLAGSEGQPVNANLFLTFCLYDVATGGTALWCESQYADVADGLFQVSLGASNPLFPNLFSQPDRWIGITIESEPEMVPRMPFPSVGYALQTAENDPSWIGNANPDDPINRPGNVGIGVSSPPAKLSVGGLSSNPAIPGSTSAGLVSFRNGLTEGIDIGKMSGVPYSGWIQSGFNQIEADALSLNPLGGHVGIGTTTPTQALDVNGASRLRGHLFDYNNLSGTIGQVLTRAGSGVLWQTVPTGLNLPYSGSVNASFAAFEIENTGTGLDEANIAINGRSLVGIGLRGEISGTSGYGVYGVAQAPTGTAHAVFGEVISPGGYSGYFTGGKFYVGGNVGIGTGNPQYRLHLHSPAVFTGLAFTNDASGSTAGDGFIIGQQYQSETINHYAIILNKENTPMVIGTNNQYSHIVLNPDGKIGIGTNSPEANLHVAGQVKITGGSPGAGKVLTSDASGLASWQSPSAGGLILPYSGTVSSPESAFQVTNSYGTAIVGRATRTSAYNEGILGVSSSTSGVGVFGYNDASTGTTFGVIGKVISTSGFAGFFDGGKVYIQGNTGIGTQNPAAKLEVAGRVRITGDCLQINQGTSSRLQIYNFSTGETPTDGLMLSNQNDAAFLWNYENTQLNFGTNNTNCMSIQANGNIGIGTGSPSGKVEIVANTSHLVLYDSNASGDRPGIQFKNNDTQYICGDDGSNELFGIYSQFSNSRIYDAKLAVFGKANSWGTYIGMTHNGANGIINTDVGNIALMPFTGKVGIGTESPTQSLHINGTLRVEGMTTGSSAGTVYRTSDGTLITGSSDIRLKEQIEPLQNSLEKIMKLNGVSFVWKNDPGMGRSIGFIAQEFEQVIPELVFTNEVDGCKGINYAEVTAVLVEALKEQQTEIERLKAENDQFRQNESQLNARLERLERALESLVEK